MRISTTQLFMQNLRAITDQQSALADTQLQIASGKKNLRPADDPVAAVRSLQVREVLARTDRFTQNIEHATTALETEEAVLDSVGDVLQRVRELALRAYNDTLSDADRQAVADEISEHLGTLLGLANSKDANGDYMFSGFQSHAVPFTSNALGGFDYHGDNGRRSLRISDQRQLAVTDSGADVFRDIRNGNGIFVSGMASGNAGTGVIDPGGLIDPSSYIADDYTITFGASNSYEVHDGSGGLITSGAYTDGAAVVFAGIEVRITGQPLAGDQFTVSPSANQDLLTTVSDLVNVLRAPASGDAERARLHYGLGRGVTDLDRALDNVLSVRVSVGARLNAASTEAETHAQNRLLLMQSLQDIEEVDLAEAISLLERQSFVLEAAHASFVRINGLSLFNEM